MLKSLPLLYPGQFMDRTLSFRQFLLPPCIKMQNIAPPEADGFYDKALEYTFSDWVVPYAFNVGVENLDEFYLGGFPDLSSFLERSESSVKIDFAELKKILNRRSTKLAKTLKKEIPGKSFIDLGCGLPFRSVVPRLLAQVFGAKNYFGVDHLHVQNEVREHEFTELGKFSSQFFRQDVFRFMEYLQFRDPVFLFIAGLEPMKESKNAEKNLKRLSSLVNAVLKPGDILMLGAGTPNMPLEKKFKRIYGDDYQEIFKVKSLRWFRR